MPAASPPQSGHDVVATHSHHSVVEEDENTEPHGSLAPGPEEEVPVAVTGNVVYPEAPAGPTSNGGSAGEEEPQEREDVGGDGDGDATSRAVKKTCLVLRGDASSCAAAERHISSLGDDILLEIFLRLPSLATLVRAASTCRAWRGAVASSPAFRRRFRAHHQLPLLGLFFQSYDPTPTPNIPAFPAFVPARSRDRDLAAAVRGGDFSLTSLQDRPEEALCWEIVDGSHGYILFVNLHARLLAMFNPLTKHIARVFDLFSMETTSFAGFLLWPDEMSTTSFRVVSFAHKESTIQIQVFSSDTGMWSVTPMLDFPARPDGVGNNSLLIDDSKHANGFLYWVYDDLRYMISLDIIKMEFSIAEMPQCLTRSFDVGRTKDSKRCIVYAHGLNIGVLMHTRDGDGVDRWVLDRVVPMDTEVQRVLPVELGVFIDLDVLEVCDGYLYLATSIMYHNPEIPCWFMSLCLETMKLEVLFQRMYDNLVHPYIMAWPASLLGNH